MSHITKVKTRLKDEDVLKFVLEKTGFKLNRRGSTSRINGTGRDVTVEFTAAGDGQVIGFRRSKADDDYFEILADWNVGKKKREEILNRIYQAYSSEKVIRSARLKGYSVITNRTNMNGQVEIVLRKVA
ncbi:MAG: DUF1257 domain-containing protein [Deltaproteobacteria bacterium]|nr:DUF1257 domain-containing protein [Deltaproteobacteria bacterium]